MMMHHDVNEDIAGSMIMALLDMPTAISAAIRVGPTGPPGPTATARMNWQSTRSAKSATTAKPARLQPIWQWSVAAMSGL